MHNITENIYQQKANQVIDYISANLHLPLQLDVIADKINVSQRQLLRIMRSALNEPLYSYVARQRVERAVLYMQTERMSLTKLAEMVGYDNPQSFSKAFKKQFGISPHKWLSMKRAEHISYRLSFEYIPFADIIEEFYFSSPQQFSRFCSNNLGVRK